MHIYPKGAGKIGINTTTPTGYVHAVSSSSSTVGLIVEGASGQTSTNIFEVQRAGGSDASFSVSHNYIDLNRNTTAAASITVYGPNAGAIPLYVKGRASQTANLTEWQDSSGSTWAHVGLSGSRFGANGSQGATFIDQYGNLTVRSNSTVFGNSIVSIGTAGATSTGITIRSVASQTANLQEWQDSTGLVLSKVDSAGRWYGTDGLFSLGVAVGATGSPGPNLYVKSRFASQVAAAIRGAASQTANLQEWQDSAGTLLANVNSFGDVTASGVFSSGSIRGGTTSTLGGFHSFTSNVPSVPVNVTRAAASQTANIQEWQNSVGTVLSRIQADGSIRSRYFGDMGDTTPYIDFSSNKLTVNSRNASYVGLVVQGVTSQTANLQEWQDSAGTVLSNITYFGGARLYDLGIKGSPAGIGWAYFGNDNTSTKNIVVRAFASQTANLTEWQDSAGTAMASVSSVGTVRASIFANLTSALTYIATNFDTSGIGIVISSAAQKGLIVRGAASQTANLQEWQNSAGTALTSVSPTGKLTITNTSASAALVEVLGTGGGQFVISQNAGISTNGGFQSIGAASYFGGYGGASNVVLYVGGASGQTGDLQRWTNFAGTTLANVDSNGKIAAPIFQSTITGTAYIVTGSNNNAIRIQTNGVANVGLQIRGETSQTADLQQWQNSGGTTIASVDTYGNAGFGGVGANSNQGLYVKTNSNPAVVGIIVQGAASQTASLQEWKNSAGTVLTKVDNLGNFTAISKSFDIIHPTKENMRLRYGSLEGPENGVYIRGTAESNIIELPDYWTGLVHEDSITVSLTSVGSAQNIYVEKIENNKIYIGGNLEKAFFTVYGERKDIDKLTVEY
jgi:hypothetical protein